MKVNFDIECTPEEARAFFGLPNVAPMQDALMKDMQERMQDYMRSMDPESIMKTWFPTMLQGWSEAQKMFWSQMGVTLPDAPKSKTK